ncbi:isochorismatase family protein [Dyadobacter fanqingshengii]|uniref:isochorismatase family protein n=1 Tax=Dyadobacter fanqingshengii TaxID=2906443 RepID=UPI0035B5B017
MADIVKESGRKQLILCGLWTEVCVAMPAIQALSVGTWRRKRSIACLGIAASGDSCTRK